MIRKKTEEFHMYSDKLTNQCWLKKVRLPVVLLNNFFSLIYEELFGIINMSNQCSYHLPNGEFL